MIDTTSLSPSLLILQNDLHLRPVLFILFVGCCSYLYFLNISSVIRWVQQIIKAAPFNISHITRVLGLPLEFPSLFSPVLEFVRILDMLIYLVGDLAELHGLELEGLL